MRDSGVAGIEQIGREIAFHAESPAQKPAAGKTGARPRSPAIGFVMGDDIPADRNGRKAHPEILTDESDPETSKRVYGQLAALIIGTADIGIHHIEIGLPFRMNVRRVGERGGIRIGVKSIPSGGDP